MKKMLCLLALLTLSAVAEKKENKEKWISLFNGENLEGWEVYIRNHEDNADPKKYFTVHNGNLHVHKDNPKDEKVEFGVIVTKKSYKNYKLRFEYKWGPKRFAPRKYTKRDSGVLIHCYQMNRSLWRFKAWPRSIECQIQETDTGDLHMVDTMATVKVNEKMVPRDHNMSFHFYDPKGEDLVTKRRILKSFQHDFLYKWNFVEVHVDGDKSKFFVNGQLVMDVKDMKKPIGDKWLPLTEGRIAFQCEGAEVMYRNIEVLPKEGY